MSESKTSSNPSIQQAIRLVEFKVTNVSFKAGESFDSSIEDELKINLGYGIDFGGNNSYGYAVNFNVRMYNEEMGFDLEIDALGLFESKRKINDEFKNSHLVNINSPAIAFPFLRSFVNTFTTNAGLNPIMLPAINFAEKQNQTSK